MTTRAALRDASYFMWPSTSKPVRYHVVIDEKNGIAGCGTWTILPREETPLDLARCVEPHMRCMRSGCRQKWPDYEPQQGLVSRL